MLDKLRLNNLTAKQRLAWLQEQLQQPGHFPLDAKSPTKP